MSRLRFPARFALILVALGALIVGVTVAISVAQGQTQRRQAALDRVADRATVALDLVRAEERSLGEFATAAGRELATSPDRPGFLARLSAAAGPGDLLLLDGQPPRLARDGALVTRDQTTAWLTATAASDAAVVADANGAAWLVVHSNAGTATLAVAQRLGSGAVAALLSPGASPAGPGVAVVRQGRYAADGSVAGARVGAGSSEAPALAALGDTGTSAIVSVGGSDVAAAAAALGGGFDLLVTGSVAGDLGGSALALALVAAALLLVALVAVFAVVQHDLQRPLQRLDRAVAALPDADFDTPIPGGGEDEIGRLAATFEAMRGELQATLRSAQARAAIATDLSALSPLGAALQAVCLRLRGATGAERVILVVHDELEEDLYSAGVADPPPPGQLLRGEGPIAAAARLGAYQPLLACPLAGCGDAELGLEVVLAAPLRIGVRSQGAIALADRPQGFGRVETELLAAAAEQVSLAIERDRVLAAARLQASTDGLTGLSNRRFLTAYLDQQLAIADRARAPFSVLMIDVDNFKRINDTLGHDVGDDVLVAVARTIEGSLRRSDLAARFGGDEFVVVMSETNLEEARVVGEKVRAAVASSPLGVGVPRSALRLTVSIGVACRLARGPGIDRLLALADNALYEAKRGGRDRCVVAPVDEPTATAATRPEAERRVGDAHE